MKATIVVFVCVALLPSIIHGAGNSVSDSDSSCYGSDDRIDDGSDDGSYFGTEEAKVALNIAQTEVDRLIEIGETIDGVFKPLQFLGIGSYAVIYAGELVGAINKTVAMKISPTKMMEEFTVNELEMFACMNAIDNPAVENYGIPAVYYHGEWENCTMIAMTLLGSQLIDIIKAPEFTLMELDVLIIFREYVRISKYMHSRGVCHNDIKLDNMMFRKHQGFLIDFNVSKKVAGNVHSNGKDCRKTDWEQFLLYMCLSWQIAFDVRRPANTLENIAKLEHSGLKRVFSKFGKYVYQGGLQNYNEMYRIITEEINCCGAQEPALVSWLKDEEKMEAKAELTENPTPDIRSIADPQ